MLHSRVAVRNGLTEVLERGISAPKRGNGPGITHIVKSRKQIIEDLLIYLEFLPNHSRACTINSPELHGVQKLVQLIQEEPRSADTAALGKSLRMLL